MEMNRMKYMFLLIQGMLEETDHLKAELERVRAENKQEKMKRVKVRDI